MELEPALAESMLVDVERKATLLRAEGPDGARLGDVAATSHVRPRGPPGFACSIGRAAHRVVRSAGCAALSRIRELEAHAPHYSAIPCISRVCPGMTARIKS